MPEFKVIITGSRSFNNYVLLEQTCNNLLREKRKTHKIIVLCGEADGADAFGKTYAHKQGFTVESFPADWAQHGKRASPIRNKEMRDYGADALIAFWDGKSSGTANMISLMKEVKKPVQVVNFKEHHCTQTEKESLTAFAAEIPDCMIEQALLADKLPNDTTAKACFRSGFTHAMETILAISLDKK